MSKVFSPKHRDGRSAAVSATAQPSVASESGLALEVHDGGDPAFAGVAGF